MVLVTGDDQATWYPAFATARLVPGQPLPDDISPVCQCQWDQLEARRRKGRRQDGRRGSRDKAGRETVDKTAATSPQTASPSRRPEEL